MAKGDRKKEQKRAEKAASAAAPETLQLSTHADGDAVASAAAAARGDDSDPSTSNPSRVVYIGHLPHGFYEKQLLGFFNQFGKLTRVRLSRNKKTGKSKHYAFLEFQYPEVAQVAAEAMNGYFMFTQKLSVKLVPADKVHPKLFKSANRKFKNIPWATLERRRHDKELTPKQLALRVARAISKDGARQKKIAAAGIDYQYPSLASLVVGKPKKTLFE